MAMKLRNVLQEKKAAIVERWLKDTLATYAGDASSFFNREKDRFANPVGHSLRVGTQAILESLLEGMEADSICRHLDDVIRIRAIQDFSPSQAVSFIFLLKRAIRAELGDDIREPQLAAELAEIDAEIDQMALFAFDIYTRCREQVCELRVNEVKRSVSAVMKRFDGGSPDPEPEPELALSGAARPGGDR